MTSVAIDIRPEVVENTLSLSYEAHVGMRFTFDDDTENPLVTSLTEAEADEFLETFKNVLREARSHRNLLRIQAQFPKDESDGNDRNASSPTSPEADSEG